MSSKISKCLDSIHVPAELAERTLKKMELCISGKYAAPKRKAGRHRLVLSFAAAAAAVCLLCSGIYAFTSGWLGEFLGDKASVYETSDFSPAIENVRISCEDPDIAAEFDSVYLIDEFLLYRLHITSSGKPFEFPGDMSGETVTGGFQWERIGEMSTKYELSPWSEISGADGAGGFYMNCTLISSNGFSAGDIIHLTPRRITFNYSGNDESLDRFNIVTNAGFDIYFEIADVPKSGRKDIDVDSYAVLDTGHRCFVDSMTVSPLCAVIETDIKEADVFIGAQSFADMILDSGEHLHMDVMSITFNADGSKIFLYWGNDSCMNPIDPETVSQIIIGDLSIDCKD